MLREPPKMKDLKPESQAKLRAYIYFEEANDYDRRTFLPNFPHRALDEPIQMQTAHCGPFTAYSEYAPTCIDHAVQMKDLDLVRDLCRCGVTVTQSALQRACDNGYLDMVTEMLNCRDGKVDDINPPQTGYLTFLWRWKEKACGRTVDFDKIRSLIKPS
jgi:hypothetical protein